MAIRQPTWIDWDAAPERLSAAVADGVLSASWAFNGRLSTATFETELWEGQRRFRLRVTYLDGWRVICWVPLTGASAYTLSHTLPTGGDYLEALALAEAWAREELKG